MIARSPSAVSKPCRPPPNSSPTRAMTAKPCATGWQNAEPRPSSHRARTARSNTIMTRPSTGSATSSSACLPPQGLAPYSHPLRPQHQKLHRRNRPCRRRHLVAVMSPDPSRTRPDDVRAIAGCSDISSGAQPPCRWKFGRTSAAMLLASSSRSNGQASAMSWHARTADGKQCCRRAALVHGPED